MTERQQLINSHKSLDSTNDNTSSAPFYGTKLQDYDESEFQATTEHRKRLDKILLDFGLGKFQYSLFLLCGFGWLTENMWLQAVIVLLPRIQKHYSISDVNIGLPNSALFFGMMLGSLFWGGHSDIHGRRDAFHWTLATASIAGILSGLTPGFWFLIAFLVAVGFGVGGTVPVDNSIILEFLPSKYHYLVTSLSVFFNLGAVLASLFAFLILPSYSCPEFTSDKLYLPCDVNLQNNGWRYVFITLSVLNGFLAFSRVFLFKLPESPQFLLAKNQPSKVVDTLNSIAKFNGLSKVFTLDDIVNVDRKATVLKADADISVFSEDPDSDIESGHAQIKNTKSKPAFEIVESHVKTHWLLKALGFDFNLIYNLFQPYYRMSTILLWIIWVFMALAYNLFTIFLPKYLELKGQDGGVNNISDVYWRYLIFSLSGIPGSLVGSWLVDTKLGRKGTLALSILFSGLAQVGFIFFKNLNLVTFCSSSVSFLVTLMYAVLYCYTPEVFDPRLRSTACGIASSLSRLLAIISPMLTGVLFSIRVWAPLEISTVLLFILVILTVMLPYETKDKSVE